VQLFLARYEAREFIFALLLLFGALFVAFRSIPTSTHKPLLNHGNDCASGAICFSGEVSEGRDFRKMLTPELEFLLQPGWKISIVPHPADEDCQDLVSILNALETGHVDASIDTSHDWTAEKEVRVSPRQFRFVTNCADYRAETERLNILRAPNMPPRIHRETVASLWTSPLGFGRLWIVDSRISHAGDTPQQKLGRIEWLRFKVEIRLPQRKQL
jgi:hypothetical protein